MSMYENFRTDTDSEKNGIVIDYGDFRVTIARAGGANKKYQRTLELLTRPYQRAINTGSLDEDIAREILYKTYARTIIRDWEVPDGTDENGTLKWKQGIEGPNGDLLPVNEDNVVLTFKQLPDLFNDLQSQAQSAALFKASLREEALGN